MTKTIAALVLHKYWSGDTSARVSFFTRELGVIQCLCKGGRTPKKQALLQAFTPLWLSVDARYDRFFVKNIESSTPSLPLTGHALFSALYLNEILYYIVQPQYPDAALFDAYLYTLNNLACTQDKLVIESLLRRFEWTLLKSCGYSFSFIYEARTQQRIRADKWYRFVAGEGFVENTVGIPGAHLLALAEDNLAEAACLKSAKTIMRMAIDHILGGREIKARSLYAR